MRTRLRYVTFGLVAGLLCNALTALAWTGPTASPPGNNVAAPVNVGTTAQVKNGDVGVNNLSAFGNELLSGLGVGTGRYLNFDYTSGGTSGTGAAGYGIHDNAGTLEFKNAGGTWQSLQAFVSGLGAGTWTTSGTNIYNANTGNVGIGTATPSDKLHVVGTIKADWDYGAGTNNYRPTLQLRRFASGVYDGSSLQIDTGMGQGLANIVGGAKLNSAGSYVYEGTRGASRLALGDGTLQLYTGSTGAGTAGSAVTWSAGNTAAVTVDVNGNVGIGTVSPATKLEVAPNTAIKVGQGYISSGGDYLHLANNEWYSASGWNATAAGAMVQLTGQAVNIYAHTAAGAHTTEMTVGPSGVNVLAPAAGGYALQVAGAPANWTEVVNWPPGTPNAYGILVGTGASYYSQFQNAAGYYSLLAYSSWGLYTNGNLGAAGFYYVSDRRLKKDIAPIPGTDALSKVLSLQPVSFNWIDPKHGAGPQIGFIAQDVKKIVPEIVATDASSTIETVDYARVAPLLVGAVQEQEKKIEAQDNKISDQQKEIDDLKGEIEALKNK